MNSALLLLSFLAYSSVAWRIPPNRYIMERRKVPPLPSKNLVLQNMGTRQYMWFPGKNQVRADGVAGFDDSFMYARVCLNADRIPGNNSQVKLRANITGLYVNDAENSYETDQSNDRTVTLSASNPTVWEYNFTNHEVTFKNEDGYFLCFNPPGFTTTKTFSDKCKFVAYQLFVEPRPLDCTSEGSNCTSGSRRHVFRKG